MSRFKLHHTHSRQWTRDHQKNVLKITALVKQLSLCRLLVVRIIERMRKSLAAQTS